MQSRQRALGVDVNGVFRCDDSRPLPLTAELLLLLLIETFVTHISSNE